MKAAMLISVGSATEARRAREDEICPCKTTKSLKKSAGDHPTESPHPHRLSLQEGLKLLTPPFESQGGRHLVRLSGN